MKDENTPAMRFGKWPWAALPHLTAPHQWGEPLPMAGFQCLFSPGGPGNVGLHIGFLYRAAPDGPPTPYGFYAAGHEPGGTDRRLQLRVLRGETLGGHVITNPAQMTETSLYVPLGLTEEQNARLLEWVENQLADENARGPYQFYRRNCGHWTARGLNDVAGFGLRYEGVLPSAVLFARLQTELARRLGEPGPG